ncbi:unnamed protein product [Paramecium octaurelia]|uniref:Uncharacterized protein n=1 Tax=Paramecium octaurelia TaxID=43137 RepID=A0A8S1SH54_PAROT|nr:unnamed protein product [Paramecium octaurelia]
MLLIWKTNKAKTLNCNFQHYQIQSIKIAFQIEKQQVKHPDSDSSMFSYVTSLIQMRFQRIFLLLFSNHEEGLVYLIDLATKDYKQCFQIKYQVSKEDCLIKEVQDLIRFLHKFIFHSYDKRQKLFRRNYFVEIKEYQEKKRPLDFLKLPKDWCTQNYFLQPMKLELPCSKILFRWLQEHNKNNQKNHFRQQILQKSEIIKIIYPLQFFYLQGKNLKLNQYLSQSRQILIKQILALYQFSFYINEQLFIISIKRFIYLNRNKIRHESIKSNLYFRLDNSLLQRDQNNIVLFYKKTSRSQNSKDQIELHWSLKLVNYFNKKIQSHTILDYSMYKHQLLIEKDIEKKTMLQKKQRGIGESLFAQLRLYLEFHLCNQLLVTFINVAKLNFQKRQEHQYMEQVKKLCKKRCQINIAVQFLIILYESWNLKIRQIRSIVSSEKKDLRLQFSFEIT